MIEAILGMTFFAGIGAMISFVVMFFVKRAKESHSTAMVIQSSIILGLGFLYFLGAGLQSPPGYPHWLIPVVFVAVCAVAHIIWRAAYPLEKLDG